MEGIHPMGTSGGATSETSPAQSNNGEQDQDGQSPAQKKAKIPRSRSGCGTCKGRKKKCDEVWDAAGSCGRCKRGAFQCVMESTRPSRSRKSLQTASLDSLSPPHMLPPLPQPFASTSQLPQHPLPAPHESMFSDPLSAYSLPDYPFPADFNNIDFSLLDLLGDVDAAASGMELLPSLIVPRNPTPPLPPHQELVQEPAVPLPPPLPPIIINGNGGTFEIPRATDASILAAQESLANESAVLEIKGFAEEWWSFYNSLNDSYFFSIPPEPREVIKNFMRTAQMNEDNVLGHAAVSAWCSSHYSSVLAKEKSPAFQEWDARAARYYQQTLTALYNTAHDLHVRIGATLDLRLAQMNRHGAAPCYFLLLAGEVFLRDALGDRPELNLARDERLEDLALRAWAYADVFRTVALRKRTTFFKLSDVPSPGDLPYDSLPTKGPGLNRRTINHHLGIPVTLLLCFADISNTLAEEDRLNPQEVEKRGREVEKKLRDYEVDCQIIRGGESSEFVSTLAAVEMWRHAALIYLYTSLMRLGPLARLVRTSLSEIIKLSDSLIDPHPSLPSIFVRSSRTGIWFLAATVALTDDDRERCREGLMECGSGKMFTDNHKTIERYWEEVDAKGVAPDWREFIARERLDVCFM